MTDRVLTILDGELLGDGNLKYQVGNLDNKGVSPSKYKNTLDTLKKLERTCTLHSNHRDLTSIIQAYNNSVEVIIDSQIAYFRTSRAFIAEPFVRLLKQRIQKQGYSVTDSFDADTIGLRTYTTVQLFMQYL